MVRDRPPSLRDNRTLRPTYWLREGRANNAAVDFVHQVGSDVAPIEIKAGKNASLKSLLSLPLFIVEQVVEHITLIQFDIADPDLLG